MKNENKEIFISGPAGRIQAIYFKNKNLKYLITDSSGKIFKNSNNLKTLLNNTNWKKF